MKTRIRVRGVSFSGIVQRDSAAFFPAQRLSLLGAGHTPKPISCFDKGLHLNKFSCLARPNSSGLMVDNPEKETPLTLCLFISPILALTYRMQTLLSVTINL
jgi:hypothetical protein